MTEVQKPETVDPQNQILAPQPGDPGGRNAISGLTAKEARDRAKLAVAGRLARVKPLVSERTFHWIANTPSKYLNLRLKTLLGEASPRDAIKAKCLECVGYEDVLPRVGDCRSRSCDLWAYRPYQEQKGKHPITSYVTHHD